MNTEERRRRSRRRKKRKKRKKQRREEKNREQMRVRIKSNNGKKMKQGLQYQTRLNLGPKSITQSKVLKKH